MTSFAIQRLAEEAGSCPDSEIGPSDPTLPGHSWGQYLVGTIPRSIRICVANLVMIGPAVWPPILDRQTEFVLHRLRRFIYFTGGIAPMHMLVPMYYCIYMFSYGPCGPEIKHYYYC